MKTMTPEDSIQRVHELAKVAHMIGEFQVSFAELFDKHDGDPYHMPAAGMLALGAMWATFLVRIHGTDRASAEGYIMDFIDAPLKAFILDRLEELDPTPEPTHPAPRKRQ